MTEIQKNKAVDTVSIDATRLMQTNVHVDGNKIVKETITIEKLVIEMKKSITKVVKCYAFSYDIPSKQKIYAYQIVDYLLSELCYNDKIIRPAKSTLLFLSTENLIKVQKKLNKKFPTINFVLVRLNRRYFPKIKYGDKSLQRAIDKRIMRREQNNVNK